MTLIAMHDPCSRWKGDFENKHPINTGLTGWDWYTTQTVSMGLFKKTAEWLMQIQFTVGFLIYFIHNLFFLL